MEILFNSRLKPARCDDCTNVNSILRWHATLNFQGQQTFVFVNFEQTVRFGSLESFTVRKIGDFPHFLSALVSNSRFIIKLVKMWPGGTLHVVVGTLKISLDRLEKKKKKKAQEGV